MLWFLVLVALVVAGAVAWNKRVSLLAKILGQPESRVERQLKARKR